MLVDHVRTNTATQRPVVAVHELVSEAPPHVVRRCTSHLPILPDPTKRRRRANRREWLALPVSGPPTVATSFSDRKRMIRFCPDGYLTAAVAYRWFGLTNETL